MPHREHPPRRAWIHLPWRTSSCPAARAFARAAVDRWHVPDVGDSVALIVTELVENVLRHTDSEMDVRVELQSGVVTVTVADDDPVPAVRREARGGGSGAGLSMVAQLAAAWGCTATASGKLVWATLRTTSPAGV